ncbi:LeoA/HP0731 family dynamin-like GTPase [Polaromonas sp. YR568]|uniref:LeoA/HP0731 family dynamin-like GTPase n=1 Tax=Polaromonas sp. YR568 TaxID=1855301 RepID=UPI00398C16E1
MNNTLNAFQARRSRNLQLLQKLSDFLQQGEDAGVSIDANLKAKLQGAIGDVTGGKLKIALVGGFSEGKTSLAAAWMERLDRSSMNISQQESSNEVKVYEVGDDMVLIDTPGLFGFKEQFNAQAGAMEKYKDTTRKYVSEAHLLLYVMNSTNPIKESHQDDLTWLFRTLKLLPRTVFVLSRFDEVADVEDEQEYENNLAIKRENVTSRLRDLIGLTDEEKNDLTVVAVAPDPFDLGTEHWLAYPEKFRALSHIVNLQSATALKIDSNGGAAMVVEDARQSIIRDVLAKEMPVAIANDEQIGRELEKLEIMSTRLTRQLGLSSERIGQVRGSLRDFAVQYFTDLILQAKGLSQETFLDFFEREIGSDGIVLNTRLQSEFERQLRAPTLDLGKMTVEFDAEIIHYNNTVTSLGKQGVNFVLKNKLITNINVLAARDGIVAAGKLVGLELGEKLRFKPWGAHKTADGLKGALAVLGLALEVWDSWEQSQREKAFRAALEKMVMNFNDQRAELLKLVDGPDFASSFFGEYSALQKSIQELEHTVTDRQAKRLQFRAWRERGEVIDAEFTVVAG